MLTEKQAEQLRELFIQCDNMKAASFMALVISEYPDITVNELTRSFKAYKLWTGPEEEYLIGLYNLVDSFSELVTIFNQKYIRSPGGISSRISKLIAEERLILNYNLYPSSEKHKPVKSKKPDSKPIMDEIYDC